MASGSSIFKSFDSGDIVSGRVQSLSYGTWADGAISQSNFYTSPSQVMNSGSSQLEIGNGAYYWDVYNLPNPDTTIESAKYFSIAYGHINGSGSGVYDENTTKYYPTKAVYKQYKNILLSPGDEYFSFATGSSGATQTDDVYIINFSTDKAKDRLDSGQFEITISGPAGIISLIDDSSYQLSTTGVKNKGIYNLVSGSLANGIYYGSGQLYEGIGLMYPTVGILVLNPAMIATKTGLPLPITDSSVINSGGSSISTRFSSNQAILLYGSPSAQNAFSNYGIIKLVSRTTEYVPTRHYFVRVKNQEFNYSNNPSFVQTGSNAGQLKIDSFITDPKVYITAVGLYDDQNDLLAVAKLSQPLLKSFDNEALIKIMLSW